MRSFPLAGTPGRGRGIIAEAYQYGSTVYKGKWKEKNSASSCRLTVILYWYFIDSCTAQAKAKHLYLSPME